MHIKKKTCLIGKLGLKCLDSVPPARIPNDAVLRSHDLEDGRDLTMKNNQLITKIGDWTRMEASMNGFIYIIYTYMFVY